MYVYKTKMSWKLHNNLAQLTKYLASLFFCKNENDFQDDHLCLLNKLHYLSYTTGQSALQTNIYKKNVTFCNGTKFSDKYFLNIYIYTNSCNFCINMVICCINGW